MYLLAHAAAFIDCPRDVAFDYAADLGNFAQWFPGVVQVDAANGLPFDTVGKQYRETVSVPWGGHGTVLLRVVEVSRATRIVTEGELPVVLPRMEIEFRDAGPGRCEVDWRMLSRANPLGRWTILPWVRHVMTGRARAGMGRLKRRLEVDRCAGA